MTTPKDRTCPNCGAGPGSPCKRPSGHAVFGGGFHAARKKEVENVTTETETKAAVGGKVRVLGENLWQALGAVRSAVPSAVPRRSTLPVTMNVLIQTTEDSRLKLTTTDLEKAITTTIGAQIDEPLSITVPYRALAEIARGISKDRVELETEGNHLTIRSGIGRVGLMGTAADEFPPLPTVDSGIGLFCPLPEFLAAFARVVDCAATDEFRPVLTGILFDVKDAVHDGTITLAAADGFRLGVDAVAATVVPVDDKKISFIMPAATLKALAIAGKQDTGELAIVVNRQPYGGQAKLVTERFEIVTQLIGGSFPDYTKLIPASRDTVRSVDRAAFADAVKGVAPYARDGSGIVRLLIGGGITVSARAEEMGEASQQVPCDYVLGEPDAKIAFDLRFLSDVLALRLSTIELGVSETSQPGVFRSPDAPAWVEVLMPMHVTW